MKNNKLELFEELLGILQLCYTVVRTDPSKATVKPLESENFILVELKDDTIIVTVSEDKIWVFVLTDLLSVGMRTMDIENILIQEAHLCHKPIALTIYLYYRLLGLLWGIRTIKELRDQDPTPDRCTYIELYGPTKDGKELMYSYRADTTSAIIVEKYMHKTIQLDCFKIFPEEYINNPVGTTEKFFEFFQDVICITKASRG